MIMPKVSARIQSAIVRLLILSYLISVGSVAKTFSNFMCDNATEINFVEVCDGEVNCADGSDETGCDNNPILFYYIYHRITPTAESCEWVEIYDYHHDKWGKYHECTPTNSPGLTELNVTGVFLNDEKEFSIALLNEIVNFYDDSSVKNIQISSNGRQFYTSYTYYRSFIITNVLKHVTRAGSIKNMEIIDRNLEKMVFDSTTNRVYYLSGSKIKVCDQNFIICVALSSKFINNPVHLAISSKHRLLFWIEKVSPLQFCLYEYAIDMHSKPRVLREDLKTPVCLTVDVIQDRVYWVDDVPSVHSIEFGNADHEVILALPEPVSSLAVFNNTVYWPSEKQLQISMCSISNCSQPTPFKQIDEKIGSVEVGALTLDHHSSPAMTIQNPCINSSCSHFCLPHLDASFSCYCEGSDQPLPGGKNNGYCEDATMIVVDQNYLYAFGFSHHHQLAPIIGAKRININSVSTVTYDSIKGNVILTEIEQQKIYSWVPRTEDLILLSDDGFGSIKSIEFDNCANNLYWIDPVRRLIRVMNLDTRLKLTILEGNSTYVPLQLVLAPTKGYMFVQFLENSSTVTIERIPMDGRRVGTLIHMDEEIDGETSLHLYYWRETDALYLLDQQTNKIKYRRGDESGFWDIMHSQSVSKMESLTSLNNGIFWLEDDMIYRGSIAAFQINVERKISLGFKKTGNGTLKMAPVVKSAVEPSFTKCMQNNGGCQELCLVSDEMTKFTCACIGNKTLVDGRFCSDMSVNVMNSTTKENSTSAPSIRLSESDLETERASTMQTDDVIHTTIHTEKHQQTESTCVKSCAPILECPPCVQTTTAEAPSTRNSEIEVQKNETKFSDGTCPVCQSPTSALSSEQSWTYYAFNWFSSSILAILVGCLLGYIFRKYHSRSQHLYSVFHRANGPLELSRMRAESTMPLCPKIINESANEEN